MTEIPKTLDEILARLDLSRERFEQSASPVDRRWYAMNYQNNLRLLRDRLGEAGVVRYAKYALWFVSNTDVEERK